MFKYIIISDTHLGSDVSQREKIIDLLRHIETENLIINGDLIDTNHLKRLNKKDWKILSLLRKLSKNTKIIYIRGNHCHDIAETLSDLLGFEFKLEYDFSLNSNKFHVEHGDKFDTFISKYWLITEIATGFYYWVRRFSGPRQIIAQYLKKRSKNFIKCIEKVKNRAVKFCTINNYDYIICGHTHHAFLEKDYKYINSGCFTEADCSYITIDKNCDIKLVYV